MRGAFRIGTSIASALQWALGAFQPPILQQHRRVTSERYNKGFQASRHTAAQEQRASIKAANRRKNKENHRGRAR